MSSKVLAASTDRLIHIRINLFPGPVPSTEVRAVAEQRWWHKGTSEVAKELLQENYPVCAWL